ncbi:D-alanyl-D-alanine carboxypeptidase family protein [Acuticoccus sp. I52.16.1]|uniref:D-alanyl-D-alanine carboxypeptidase family protein n=1 Tax=Acuticoccus sp. I52.16.1 TaxID=2928472 RepID=UPI001FD4E907|nr:D-alanyl-D-alanine carboxypeptidase family protein [Acuticoccus sp. I52.16.1]UOM36056.1 D-alanyl-D-alanine carboxypeptidase [Acuticoccus sp. I52.16.1]
MTLLRLALVVVLAPALVAAVNLVRPVPARAEVGSYLLFDMADGTILADYEATALWYPASITKLMTAYVTFQAIADGRLKLTSPVKISPQASQQPPSRMGFPVGTTLTVETALRILMTKSANDIAFALAEAVGGTLGGFVDRMNAAAAQIGMTASAYDNPHGLPNTKQVTTARDIALLMMALARDFPERADFFSMNAVKLGSRVIPNHNAILRHVAGADGMKTGFICASGFNVAAAATRGGRRLGAVVLGGLTSQERNERTAELLQKGFRALESGGSIALDGFDDPDGRLDLRPVSGTRLDLGNVETLQNPAGMEAVDRRDEVCGASRPITRYSDGTVATVAAVEAQRARVAAYRLKRNAREQLRAEVLSAPRPDPTAATPAPTPRRQLADDALVPVGWEPSGPTWSPRSNPTRDAATDAPATANAAPTAGLAPEGWVPAPARPLANPLQIAELRGAIPQPEIERPLSYLEPRTPLTPLPISLGGADEGRPRPLSGEIVGGGPPPLPPTRPAPAADDPAAEPGSDVT